MNGVPKFPYEFTSTATSADGVTPASTLAAGPIILTQYSLTHPKLGYGANVQIQSPNTAPYVYQWNLGVEQSLGHNLMADISYVGTAAHKFDVGRLNYVNTNQVPYAVAKAAAVAQGTTNPNLRPNPNFNYIEPINPRWGNSIYNVLQVKLEQRAKWGISYLLSYTWAKYIDNGSEAYGFLGGSWPIDIYNLRLERTDLPSPREFHDEFRCDTHPRYSPNGRKVVVDSPHAGGGRQLYLLDISSIVESRD